LQSSSDLQSSSASHSGFYQWLIQNTNYIADYKKLIETLNMFDITDLEYSLDIGTIVGNKKNLHEFLKKYNFIFMNHTKVK
jgi:hypothetical protein